MPLLPPAVADLVLGSTCVGCDRPGSMLCRACQDALPSAAATAWPTPTPPGLVTPWAAAEYAGAVRAMVVGHKERAQHAFRPHLADLLHLAARAATGPADGTAWLLVPVPSRPGSERRRGHDPLGAVLRGTVRRLRSEGHDALAAPLLVSSRAVLDQAGLDTAARAANLAGSMRVPTHRLRRVARRRTRARVVVCDDVLTTGATAREAQRALTVVGLPPVAVVTVAATRRRNAGSSR